MIISICGLLLLLVGLFALGLQRLYSTIPAKELKRLASRGDHLAAALYAPVAYGSSMRLLLWLLFGLGMSFGVLFITQGLVAPIAYGVIALSIVGIITIQSVRLTVHSARFAVHAAPLLRWILQYVHTPLSVVAGGVAKVRRHSAHSGMYEKEDLLDLLEQQKGQIDNRISYRELEVITRAARFDDRQAADIYLPMSRVKMVNAADHIGPVLLDELHDSGQTSFLVYQEAPEHVVGTLFLRDAVEATHGGRVADLIHSKLAYAHEDFTLRQVMQAFVRTSQHMVVVINSFEEAVGVITLDNILAELLGETTEDTALAYEDRASVAAFKPQLEPVEVAVTDADPPAETGDPSSDPEDAQSKQSSPEATEVVE